MSSSCLPKTATQLLPKKTQKTHLISSGAGATYPGPNLSSGYGCISLWSPSVWTFKHGAKLEVNSLLDSQYSSATIRTFGKYTDNSVHFTHPLASYTHHTSSHISMLHVGRPHFSYPCIHVFSCSLCQKYPTVDTHYNCRMIYKSRTGKTCT